ncbi:TRAP transporter substrate-binding protein [Arthrobacter sp. Hor0625]|uniref:TRAP transporter substrate-binding protein n=1 Tax=Arthrobacter sp. Hor0625 TaxID=3457358 RepID=UPI00403E4218
MLRRATIMAAAAVLGCGGCAANPPPPAGDDGYAADATVLTLATAGGPDGRSSSQVQEFARQVKELSRGSIRIELVLKAAAEEAGAWDQAVAQSTEGGDFDMALIATRTWESEGVQTFAALSAPFLATSDQVMAEVVAPEMAGSMLAGLKAVGLTGLALLPDGPRMIFSFDGPVALPEDLAGKVVRAPRSTTGYATLKALGAVPRTLAGKLFTDALDAGAVAAAESSFSRAATFTKPSNTIGNLPLYSKVNSLVINTSTYAHLPADERRILLEAAGRTRDAVTGSLLRTADEAAAYCRHGGTVVAASEEELAAFNAAVAPVYAQLEKDAGTRALIAKIRALAAASGAAAAVAPCSPGG